ncbi:uncharacterized protein BP5553_05891 [Venustampulla echinocandica]|uniref:Transaldolase n=1 Tax=Venustampulla echinocandica TaxID=2656787 RepID=A0A370TLZ7_9HELO|nr:uncharacterized protein BP5553_05891 [Venustampulla echinocandica]RDL36539.1 hypothetical protein BP5553_05891 [Venustampulla echinocandica]
MAQTPLQLLQSRTSVACATIDLEVPKTVGSFVDCTSDQVIAYLELHKPEHKKTIREAVSFASSKEIVTLYPTVPREELVVEIITNPHFCYDTAATVDNARSKLGYTLHGDPWWLIFVGIVHVSEILNPDVDTKRICINIPSTWEGLQACRILEPTRITTLATAVFTLEQASLAGEVGCHYIAPYVNELVVHFDPESFDDEKSLDFSVAAQRYYKENNIVTQVLAASLTSVYEIMALAGVNHITVAPVLAQELAAAPVTSLDLKSIFDFREFKGPLRWLPRSLPRFADDHNAFLSSNTLKLANEGQSRLANAIEIFRGFQDKLTHMMKIEMAEMGMEKGI